MEKHQRILNSVLQSGSAASAAIVPAEEKSVRNAGDGAVVSTEAVESQVTPKSYESVEAFEKQEQIASRCMSEVAGIELIKAVSGKILVVSEKKRILPKLTLLGGFGTGKLLTSKVVSQAPFSLLVVSRMLSSAPYLISKVILMLQLFFTIFKASQVRALL